MIVVGMGSPHDLGFGSTPGLGGLSGSGFRGIRIGCGLGLGMMGVFAGAIPGAIDGRPEPKTTSTPCFMIASVLARYSSTPFPLMTGRPSIVPSFLVVARAIEPQLLYDFVVNFLGYWCPRTRQAAEQLAHDVERHLCVEAGHDFLAIAGKHA